MTMRITGMNSGLDTESIITELVKAKSEKKNKLVKEQTKLQWKQDAWKELNSKVYSFYTKTLSNMRLTTDYYKKTTKVSNANAASVITGANAVNGVQTLKIDQLAKSGYLTGANIEQKHGKQITASSKLGELGFSVTGSSFKITLGDGTSEDIEYTADTKISDIVSQLKSVGVNASFDEASGRFFISSKATGAKNDFTLSADADNTILSDLGLKSLSAEDRASYVEKCIIKNGIYEAKDASEQAKAAAKALNESATEIDGSDAVIQLNGAIFTKDTNTFEINGLTITANAVTEDEFTITTENDTDGIYDMIKNFIKEYNALINEMDKLYNADSAKGYEPLTDEEKEAMSEKEVEKWEEKIKGSILRRDSTLSSVASAMKQVMSQKVYALVRGADGKEVQGEALGYLSDFGIGTGGYFTSKDNEKNAYHIDGDPDDSVTSTNADKLKTAIANDPDKVVEFFSSLSKSLYNKLGDMMKKTEYSSSFTLYNDIAMKDEYKDYTDKIADQEELITEYEDRYYKKFSAMETAMAKMQSKQNAISGLLGM